MANPVQTVWITKYALTKGVLKTAAEIVVTESGATYASTRGAGSKLHLFTRDYFLNEHEAIERAIQMKDRKVAALQKQIQKLKGELIKVVSEKEF